MVYGSRYITIWMHFSGHIFVSISEWKNRFFKNKSELKANMKIISIIKLCLNERNVQKYVYATNNRDNIQSQRFFLIIH